MNEAILLRVSDHKVRRSVATCAGNTTCSSRCYQTVPIHFGAERWDHAGDLILKNITPKQFLSDLGSCQRVKLVESCFKQSIVATNEFRETKRRMEQVQGTYRCVTKQKTWDLLKDYLVFNLIRDDVDSLKTPHESLHKTALMVGRIVVKEGHRLGSQVGVIDCQIHKNEKMKVNCIITDPNSDLDIAVVLLVFTGTYSFSSKDSEQLTEGTVVIMSLDEFKGKHFFR